MADTAKFRDVNLQILLLLTPVEKTYRQLSIIWGVTPKMIKE